MKSVLALIGTVLSGFVVAGAVNRYGDDDYDRPLLAAGLGLGCVMLLAAVLAAQAQREEKA